MGGELADAEFWLPPEFLTDDDITMDNNENLNDRFCFPTEFPYEFADSPPLNPDHQLAELTAQLSLHRSHQLTTFKKNDWGMAGSPQSTLSQLGSWAGRSPGSSNEGSPNGPSQVCSPPATPLGAYDEAWDLIHQAAGQVAKLQMDGAALGVARNRLSLHRPTPNHNNSNSSLYDAYVNQARVEQMVRLRLQRVQERYATWSNGQIKDEWAYRQQMAQGVQARAGMIVDAEDSGRGEAAWPRPHSFRPLNQKSGSGLVVGGVGSGNVGVKKQCAGTGVFLPRPYENNNNNHKYSSHNYNNKSKPAEWRKRAVVPPALIPGIVSVPDDISDSNDVVEQPQGLPCFDAGCMVDYDTLVARRNALLMLHQRRNAWPQVTTNRQVALTRGWMY